MHEIIIPTNPCKCKCHYKSETGFWFDDTCCFIHDTKYINLDGSIDLKVYNDAWSEFKNHNKKPPYIDGGEYITNKTKHDTMFVKEKRKK